jgi:uncharacterized membrane protein
VREFALALLHDISAFFDFSILLLAVQLQKARFRFVLSSRIGLFLFRRRELQEVVEPNLKLPNRAPFNFLEFALLEY